MPLGDTCQTITRLPATPTLFTQSFLKLNGFVRINSLCYKPEGILDVDISVEADGAEVKDGCGRTHYVEGDPGITELCAEDPVAEEVIDHSEGHDQSGDEEVGYSQRRQEEVPDPPEAAVCVYSHAHQDVAEYGDKYQDREKYS